MPIQAEIRQEVMVTEAWIIKMQGMDIEGGELNDMERRGLTKWQATSHLRSFLPTGAPT